MAKLSDIRSDVDAMTNGVWVDYAAGIRLKIARMWNKEHSRFMAKLSEERLDEIRASVSTQKIERDIMKESVAMTILKDWANLEDDDGEPIPFSVEKAIEIFSDPAYQDFYDFVLTTASRRNLYREANLRESAKN